MKLLKKYKKIDFKDAFAESMKSELMYYFWSKYEWEVCITELFDGEKKAETKVDVYMQVMQNYDVFVDYVWGHKNEI
jgi:hypothetical protein